MMSRPPSVTQSQQYTQSLSIPQAYQKKPSHFITYLALIILSLLLLLVGLFVYFNLIIKPKNLINNDFPVSLNNPHINSAFISYVFDGKLVDISTKEAKTQLITDIEGEGVPDFIVSNNTRVIFVGNSSKKLVIGDIKALKKGDRLQLTSYYNINSKHWSLPIIKVIGIEFQSSQNFSSESAEILQ